MGRPALWVRVRPTARLRRVAGASVLLLLLLLLLARSGVYPTAPGHSFSLPPAARERRNPSLSARECAAAFPGLTHEIDRAVAEGPFTLIKPLSTLGPLIARIRDGKASPPLFQLCLFYTCAHTHTYTLGALFSQAKPAD